MKPDWIVIFQPVAMPPVETFNTVLMLSRPIGFVLNEHYYSAAVRQSDGETYEFETGTILYPVDSKEDIIDSIEKNNGGECLFHLKEFVNENCYFGFLPDPSGCTTLILHISASTSDGPLSRFLYGKDGTVDGKILKLLSELAQYLKANFYVGGPLEGIPMRHIKEEDLYLGRKESFRPGLIAYNCNLDMAKLEAVWSDLPFKCSIHGYQIRSWHGAP